MCIVCNCGDNNSGDKFLHNWYKTIHYFKKAEKNMLDCSKQDPKYDKIHKKMVHMRKQLAIIEQTRENAS